MLDQKEENKEVLDELKKAAEENKADNNKISNDEAADIKGVFEGDAEDEIAADSENITDNLETQNESSNDIGMKDEESKIQFSKILSSIVIDAGIMGAVSFVGLYLVDAILRAVGFHIVDKSGASLVIFVIIYILYGTIMISGKKHSTFGMRANKLKVALDK